MDTPTYQFKAKIWIYSGVAAWHFITVPENVSKKIKNEFGDMAQGWGSLPINATIGQTTWKTSIFPDKKLNAYLLPIKKDVRKSEKIKAHDNVSITIEIQT
jgi:hypothetical protein